MSMINLIEKFWDSEVRQMLTLATGIYFDYYLSAIGIDEQPPVAPFTSFPSGVFTKNIIKIEKK